MTSRHPNLLAGIRSSVTRIALAVGVLISLASLAHAGLNVTRLTPDFNPGSLPHIVNTALHLPVDVDVAPGNSDYFFVSQLGGLGSDGSDGDDITKADGRIVLLDRNTGSVDFNSPFLAIPDTNLFDPVGGVPEVGLFSTAFHPDFETNGKLYVSVAVNYPGPAPSLQPRDSRTPPFKLAVREYVADPNNITAGASFSKTIFEIDQPEFNHNGSWLGFNPIETAQGDNHLYITLGDGGGQHDPFNYGQDKEHLLGTVMRIDIDGDDFADPDINYAIPQDNPFVGVGVAGRDEIWAYGFRNPWRASFDRENGDMFIADVGQFTWEEINYLPGDVGPMDDRNFGWRAREGFVSTPTGPGIGDRPPTDNVNPIIAYLHGSGDFRGNSVAGGLVYRGPVEELYGMFIFADSVSGNIWGFDVDDIGTFDDDNPADSLVLLNDVLAPTDGGYVAIVGFAEDEQGNLLIIDHGFDGAGIGGHIYRVDFVLSGDYNNDGLVDAADYTVWRDNLGSAAGTLPNDTDGGTVGVAQYNTWKANYGQTLPGMLAQSSIPEPTTLWLLLGAGCCVAGMHRRRWSGGLVVVLLLVPTAPTLAISTGQLDDFQDGSVAAWGPNFSQVAENVADAGQEGAGDHALLASTIGAAGRTGSRLAIVNNDQWTGDWLSAGVRAIEFDALNPSDFDVRLWLGIAGPEPPLSSGAGGTYVSLASALLEVGSGWNRYRIAVTADDFEQATNHNTGSIDQALADVEQFRIFHNVAGRIDPSAPNNFIGDAIEGAFYIDNIQFVAIPEPGTLTVAMLTSALCSVLSVRCRRR